MFCGSIASYKLTFENILYSVTSWSGDLFLTNQLETSLPNFEVLKINHMLRAVAKTDQYAFNCLAVKDE